ncbi:ABC transporter permease [Parafilimonas sp.]|uniref:ABC transporter permease n=1 Tax=Parafilimonas sp. TaxID=1969739 RepID=UPI0039E34D02
MLKFIFKNAWRTVKTFWLYNAINIMGLSVAVAAALFITAIIQYENGYDSFHKNSNSIYRVVEDMHYEGSGYQKGAGTPYPLAAFLKNQNGEVKLATRVFPATIPPLYPSLHVAQKTENFDLSNALCTDADFFKIFSFSLWAGKKEDLFNERNTILLSKKYAGKIFKDPAKAVNQIIDLSCNDTVIKARVTGVFNDFSPQSHLQTDALLPFPAGFDTTEMGRNWSVLLGSTYLLIPGNISKKSAEKKYTEQIHQENQSIDVELQPLKDIHAKSGNLFYDSLNFQKSDQANLNLYVISAIILLLAACANCINIHFALLNYRGREAAIRKIAGATRAQLGCQFLTENAITTGASIMAGFLMVVLSFPWLQSFLDIKPVRTSLINVHFVLALSGLFFILWLLVSSYPAFAFSSAGIVNLLKNKSLFKASKNSLMRLLIICQFSFSFIFIVSIITIHKQNTLLNTADLGFNYDNVLNIKVNHILNSSSLHYIINKLKQVPDVEDVSYSKRRIGDGAGIFGIYYTDNAGRQHGETALTYFVSPNFLDFFKVRFIQGKNFDENNYRDTYIINQCMLKKTGWNDFFHKAIHLSWLPEGTLNGVVADFHFASLHEQMQPLLICPVIDSSDIQNIYIKLNAPGISKEGKDELARIWKSVFNEPPVYGYMSDWLRSAYKDEKRLSNVILIASALSVFVAAIGLFGMSVFSSQKRIQEISIRKVLGAKSSSLFMHLSLDYIRAGIASFIIAVPVSVYLLKKWLENYSYRAELTVGSFILTAALLLIVTLLAVFHQLYKVSTVNPVQHLKE